MGSAYSASRKNRDRGKKKKRGQDGLDVEERAQAGWRRRDGDWMKKGRG